MSGTEQSAEPHVHRFLVASIDLNNKVRGVMCQSIEPKFAHVLFAESVSMFKAGEDPVGLFNDLLVNPTHNSLDEIMSADVEMVFMYQVVTGKLHCWKQRSPGDFDTIASLMFPMSDIPHPQMYTEVSLHKAYTFALRLEPGFIVDMDIFQNQNLLAAEYAKWLETNPYK